MNSFFNYLNEDNSKEIELEQLSSIAKKAASTYKDRNDFLQKVSKTIATKKEEALHQQHLINDYKQKLLLSHKQLFDYVNSINDPKLIKAVNEFIVAYNDCEENGFDEINGALLEQAHRTLNGFAIQRKDKHLEDLNSQRRKLNQDIAYSEQAIQRFNEKIQERQSVANHLLNGNPDKLGDASLSLTQLKSIRDIAKAKADALKDIVFPKSSKPSSTILPQEEDDEEEQPKFVYTPRQKHPDERHKAVPGKPKNPLTVTLAKFFLPKILEHIKTNERISLQDISSLINQYVNDPQLKGLKELKDNDQKYKGQTYYKHAIQDFVRSLINSSFPILTKHSPNAFSKVHTFTTSPDLKENLLFYFHS